MSCSGLIERLQKLYQLLETLESYMDPNDDEVTAGIVDLCLQKGVSPVLTKPQFRLVGKVGTKPNIMFPSYNLAVYLHSKTVPKSQLCFYNEVEDLLRKRYGLRVLSIVYRNKSCGEVERIFGEVFRELKKE